ncbi:hypothetical protein [Gordonia araii]|uniref:hypothetical protein n=1 Tax=Gordonia araii TaxID=263909 RepID=UPI0002FA3083|nr:hypothetical protein [Gordonia araii]
MARVVDGVAGVRSRDGYRRSGLLAGRFADSHPRFAQRWPRVAEAVDAPATAITADTLKIVLGVAMCATRNPRHQGLLAAGDLALSRLSTARTNLGREGADDMMDALSVMALLTAAEGDAAPRRYLAAVNVQLGLSYVMAGVAKLASYEWNSGEAVRMIMSTESFGDPALHRWFSDHRRAGQAITWTVAVGEVCYPLLYLVPNPRAARALAAAGMGFHLVVAAKMSLPQFVYAFGAAYPAVFWAIGQRHSARLAPAP